MSISNLDYTSYNYLSNLASVNANEVNTDILTKSDPDISDLQFDMLEGINTNQTIQEQINALVAGLETIGYWGAFYSTTTQTNPTANTANLITVNNSDPSNNQVEIGATSSQIKVLNNGVYNFQFSAQYEKTDGGKDDFSLWFLKNGTNISNSNSVFSIHDNNGSLIASLNFMLKLSANDYIQLAWSSADVDMALTYIGAQTTPTRPATPSVIITVHQVANILTGPVGPTGPIGTNGTNGTNGATGPTGPTGTNGTNGTNGSNGSNGAKGDKGNQGDTGPAGPAGDGPIAIAALALATSTAATLGGYITSNNASQAAQDVLIAGLATDLGLVETDVGLLQVKTTDITYGFLTGTTFAGKVNVGNVVLNQSTASTFGSGISSISTISSSAGTSQFSSLLVNNNLEVTNDAVVTGNVFISRTNRSAKKLVLYDNGTGNDYDYTGCFTSFTGVANFFNSEIDGAVGSAFRWNSGDGLGLSRTLLKSLSSTAEATYTVSSSFLKSAGASQQIQLIKDVASTTVGIDFMADNAGVNDFDGQIIQAKGNSLDDNKGTMTVQSGALEINALNSGLQMQSTTATLIQSGTTMDLISSTAMDLASTTGGISLTGNTNLGLTSGSSMVVNCGADLDINSITTTSLTSGTGMSLTATTSNLALVTSSATGDITLTSGRSIDFTTNTTGGIVKFNSNKDQDIVRITNSAFDSKVVVGSTTTGFRLAVNNNSTANFNALGTTQLNLNTNNAKMTLTAVGEMELNSVAFDLNATGNITADTTGSMNFTASTSMNLSCGGTLVFSPNSFNMNAPVNIEFQADADMILGGGVTTYLSGGTGGLNINSGTTVSISAPDYIEVVDTNFHIAQDTYPPTNEYQLGYGDL